MRHRPFALGHGSFLRSSQDGREGRTGPGCRPCGFRLTAIRVKGPVRTTPAAPFPWLDSAAASPRLRRITHPHAWTAMARDVDIARRRTEARPLPVRRGFVSWMRAIHARLRPRWSSWRVAWLGVLTRLLLPDVTAVPEGVASLAAWVVAGCAAWIAASWLEVDHARRRLAHDRSGLRCVAGWRLRPGLVEAEPDLVLAIDLLSWLFDHARIVWRPVRGHRRRYRSTYAVPLRTLARAWARQTGVSGRRADRLLASGLCDRCGVVLRVAVGNADAYRLTDSSLPAALAHLERASGASVIAWQLGRDPEWDRPGSRLASPSIDEADLGPGETGTSVAARAR